MELPGEESISEVNKLQRFQKKINDYLAELSKYPTKEFIEFLLMNREDQRLSQLKPAGSNINLARSMREPSDSAELLRALWKSEALVAVEVALNNNPLTEEDFYTISVGYYESNAKMQVKLGDVLGFYSTMRRKFRGFPFTRLPHGLELEKVSGKKLVRKLQAFLLEIANDVDLLGSKVYEFFSYEAIKKLCKLPEDMARHDIQLDDFALTAVVRKVSVGLQNQRQLIIVMHEVIIEVQH